ncbi:hypothetical protein PC116_g24881 [Phytophthora cactorum]|nr:hypothetical protein PC128_g17649 [Phytophthora cactorum]KAG4051327.1 hypothetical protein PC123_g13459 [Phytophthora cactorum]KAG4226715.1 hypothetical protein PC116_g24881 [Phytophthora cactorum]
MRRGLWRQEGSERQQNWASGTRRQSRVDSGVQQRRLLEEQQQA